MAIKPLENDDESVILTWLDDAGDDDDEEFEG